MHHQFLRFDSSFVVLSKSGIIKHHDSRTLFSLSCYDRSTSHIIIPHYNQLIHHASYPPPDIYHTIPNMEPLDAIPSRYCHSHLPPLVCRSSGRLHHHCHTKLLLTTHRLRHSHHDTNTQSNPTHDSFNHLTSEWAAWKQTEHRPLNIFIFLYISIY